MINIKKSLSDRRNYKLIKLPNSLKALLIHDPEADTSSASMAVRVGAFSDPKEFPGLAHFCEHMLFMGTKKYPKIDDFSEYLSANNGSSNAFTDTYATVYKFECSNQGFLPALDKFSQFFISPLLDRSSVEKELRAIESENQKNLQSDVWRQMQLIRSESKPDSITHIFSTGNSATLNPNGNIDEPREALIKFFNDYYHACKMSLVIDSPLELDDIEKITREYFNDITSGDGKVLNYYNKDKPTYDSTNLKRYYTIESIIDKNKLKLQWYLEPCMDKYKEKPLNYLSSLFGHEGENSLYSTLVADGLATELVCGPYDITNILSVFYITIVLTDKGLEQRDEIIKRTLKFIKKIQSLPINKTFFEENKIVKQITFDYKNREKPIDYTEELAYTMNDFAEEDILSGPYLFENYNEELISYYLSKLVPSEMNIYFSTKKEDILKFADKKEKWYGTKYFYSEIPSNIIDEYSSFDPSKDEVCSHPTGYPKINKFLPKNLDLIQFEKQQDKPELLLKNEKCEIWYKPDIVFKRPKATIYCQIYLDKSIINYEEYESIAYTWNLVLETKLKEVSYMAAEANLKFSFHVNNEGMFLKINGFSDSMKSALEELMKAFISIKLEDNISLFTDQLQKQIKEMGNFYYSNPYSQILAYFDYLRTEPSVTPCKKLEKLTSLLDEKDNLITEKIKYFTENYKNSMKYTWLIQGNINKEDALIINSICDNLINSNTLDQDQVKSFRIVDQLVNTTYSYTLNAINVNEPNSSIISSFSWGEVPSLKEKMAIDLTNSLIKEKFFDSLRTHQGLGYIVTSFVREQRKIPSLLFLVQSNVQGPEYIWEKINEFLEERRTYVNSIDDSTFEMHREALISDKQKKDLSLDEEAIRNFNEIKKRDYEFDIKQKMVTELKSIDKKDVIDCFEKIFYKEKRRLDIMFLSPKHKESNEIAITDYNKKANDERRYFISSIQNYKLRNKLHPDFYLEDEKLKI